MSLRANFTWTAGSRAIYAASHWLLLILVARLAGVEQLGQFAYALAVTGPIVMFAQLNMRGYMATDAALQFRIADYHRAQQVTLAVAMVVVTAVALACNSTALAMTVSLVGLYKAAESLSNIYYGAQQRAERMREIALSVAAHGILAVFGMGTVLAFGGDVVMGTAAILMMWSVLLLGYDARQVRWTDASPRADLATPAVRRHVVWAVIVACFPLGLVMALLALRINIPMYFLQSHAGSSAVGYFSAVAYFIAAGNMITGSLLQAAAPRLANLSHDGHGRSAQRLFLRLGLVAGGIGLLGIAVAVVLGEPLLGLIYGPAFAELGPVLIWIMTGATLMYLSQWWGLALTATRRFREQIAANLAGVLGTVVLSAWWIPAEGATGAAQAFTGGALLTCVICGMLAHVRVPFLRGRIDVQQASDLGSTLYRP